jgi:hypothetical protein
VEATSRDRGRWHRDSEGICPNNRVGILKQLIPSGVDVDSSEAPASSRRAKASPYGISPVSVSDFAAKARMADLRPPWQRRSLTVVSTPPGIRASPLGTGDPRIVIISLQDHGMPIRPAQISIFEFTLERHSPQQRSTNRVVMIQYIIILLKY